MAAQQGGAALVTPAASLTPMVPATETEPLSPLTSSIDLQDTVSGTLSALLEEPLPAERGGPSNENVLSAAEVLLSSALDTPMNDKPLAEMTIAPEPLVGTGEDIQALLSLMAVEMSAPVNQTEQAFGDAPHEDEGPMPANNPVLTVEVTQEVKAVEVNLESDGRDDIASEAAFSTPEPGASQTPTPAIEGDGEVTPGESFWRWLADGLNSNQIPINTVEARVHLISGFVFITVPGIFYLYLKQAGLDGSQREAFQEDFERLDKHRRGKGKRFYFAHLVVAH